MQKGLQHHREPSSLLKKSLHAQRDLKCAGDVFCLDGQGGSLS
jgi:hypothetical protein